MIKIRLMIEQNFAIINTFGILATTRYVLELLIWFRLLKKDVETYACWHASLLIADQLEHNKAYLEKVKEEIQFFKELGRREEDESERALASLVEKHGASLRPDSVRESIDMIMENIDRSARRKFSLYSEQAKTNGYGLQAYLMEQKVVPQWERLIEQVQMQRTIAQEQMPKWPNKKWRWKDEAENAGLIQQFEFVYSYTSRLLHAKLMSFTTNQKNLELIELVMFLDFVYMSMLELIEIAEQTSDLANKSLS
jgi:hypothetical protein